MGWSAVIIDHIILRVRATLTGDVLSTISAAIARAAGRRSSGSWTLRTSPPLVRYRDPSTGALRVEALFPNPGNALRPGQFARVRVKFENQDDPAFYDPSIADVWAYALP